MSNDLNQKPITIANASGFPLHECEGEGEGGRSLMK